MKRAVFVLFALLALSCAQAQDSYFGIRADAHFFFDTGGLIPLPGVQLGLPVLDNAEVRASLLSLGFVNLVQAEVLYTVDLSATLRGYGGIGGDIGRTVFDEGWIIGLHATAGLENNLGNSVGLFIEVQPLYILQAPLFVWENDSENSVAFLGKLNIGVNFYF